MAGAHLDARDLGVDGQRAPDELQRQLVAQHLLERVRHRASASATSAARWSGSPPELVRAAGDGLRQRLGPADEQRRQLHRDLGVVERTVGAGVGAQIVDEVGRTVAAGGAPLGDELDEVRVQLGVRRLARRR